MIGIIGAMDVETDMLKNEMALDKMLEMAGMSFYAGSLRNVEVVVVTCGIGKVNAAICTQILINKFNVSSVINTGVSGGLNEKLKIGDLVIATDCIEHDFDVTIFGYELGTIPRQADSVYKADQYLSEMAYKAGKNFSDHEVHRGRIVSGDQFVSSVEKKQFLIDTFNAYTTEMESAAIAHTCYLNQCPFAIIRAISDQANGEAPENFDEFSQHAAIISNKIVLAMLAELS